MDTREVIARFEAERQALALMDHPNIAKVLDAGVTDSGRPFFVMEYVRGVSITEFCDRNKINLKSRLQLFIDVCHAIQHAHQKGIVHRDIKPSNILVEYADDKMVPKVIDFGVAKALNQRLSEETVFTKEGQLIGTQEYMSPEQAEMTSLDVDTRSDIYSLGVLLYQLLTGMLPFERESLRQAGLAEIHRIIREVDPPKPSTRFSSLDEGDSSVQAVRMGMDTRSLRRELQGELDWIVLRAMAKDRSMRYPSASEFARDLDRYVRQEPVEAKPPGASYRIRKFIRRHRVAAAIGLVLAVSLLVGTTTTTLAMLWALNEKQLTIEAKNKAEQEGLRASNAEKDLWKALIDLRTKTLVASLDVTYGELYATGYFFGSVDDTRDSFNPTTTREFFVSAVLREKVHAFVFGVRPHGSYLLLFPQEDTVLPGCVDILAGEGPGLQLNEGLNSFFVVASFDPLPSFSEWISKYDFLAAPKFIIRPPHPDEPVRAAKCRFDGEHFDDEYPNERFEHLCKLLQTDDSIDVFHGVSFYVAEADAHNGFGH